MTDGRDSVPYKDRKTVQTSLTLHPGDKELIGWGAEFLGCTRSEYIRSCIRAYTSQLQTLRRASGAR